MIQNDNMEMGGYLPLELNKGLEYFERFHDIDIWRFNSGRSSIVAALNSMKVRRVHIPFYNCYMVEEALKKNGYKIQKYKIDSNFLPQINRFEEDDWLVYIDYFGVCNKKVKELIAEKYKRVIFDNTQAFYAQPIIKEFVFNVYSCRKFFGVADGAYLVAKEGQKVITEYEEDSSWKRSSFLLRSIEEGTNNAYGDSLRSEEEIGFQVKLMSKLTRKIMQSVNYESVAMTRIRNFNCLNKFLCDINELNISFEDEEVPMVYPLLIRNDNLRMELIKSKIYVPQWWKYLINELDNEDYEVILSKYLIPLPIDQRYSEEQMTFLANTVKSHLV